ncbi:MAG: signal peptidase I [Thermomicrobiales bacterium]
MTFHPRETAPEAGTIENPPAPPLSDGLFDSTSYADAVESTESIDSQQQRKGASRTRAVREIVETLLLAVVIFAAVRLVVLNFRVDGGSMAPNLQDEEMLLVNRNAYFHFDLNTLRNILPGGDRDGEDIVYLFEPPERGDIVVFNPPVSSPKPYIKRVIGLPGETVTIENGYVEIDGQRLEEPYIDGDITDCTRDPCSWEVDEGEVFVMGDNRRNSSDSRTFGSISVDDIIGKAWITYWPVDEIDLVPHYDYPNLSD